MTELPTSFGKYFLTEKLATGGMAEIYLAKLVGPGGFEKQLVIKQIHPRLSGQRQFVDLFVAEAKILVTLAHGNIVPVYELGVFDDMYFIAMEYIDGPTLHRLADALANKNVKMEPSVAVWITARILEGLDYAHRKGEGVIHRDLSPRNVMMSRDGEVKLVDFGIAVTLGGNDDSGVTTTAAPTGSFPYMSPEQVRREPLTAQTDVFSAGVLLWEMLVGERLFARNDPDATLAAVTGADIPRPSFVRPAVESKLDDVVMRALARDRTERYPNAAEMLAELQRYLYGLEEMPGPRDVAALVAKYVPAERRRVSTAGERAPTDAGGAPHTAVIPRSKRARTETFATHVELKNMLERATPLVPIAAITDSAPPRTEPPKPEPEPEPPKVLRPVPTPSRGLLVVAALGTLALGGAALFVFARGRAAMLRPDAAPKLDAPFYAQEPDASAPSPDVPTPPPPIDATPAIISDASARPHAEAGAPPVAIDAAAKPRGNGTVKIGADPWGEIVIDGVPKGRTPAELTLSAGHHDIEVIYRGEDPPKKKTFAIDLAPDQTVPLQADFH